MLEQFLIISGKKIVGTFILREANDGHKIERMGILFEYRSKRYGGLTLDEIKMYSKKSSKSKIILDSIYAIRKFYANSGFFSIGSKYSKAGLPRVKMYFQVE
ncbi:MAG: GNAT family N-acetyltransferase [Nitrosopumilus sp.]